MKNIIQKALLPLLLGLGIFTGYLYAQSVPSSPPAIRISSAKHDFGVVAPGVDLVYDFPIENIGGQNLRITKINVTCGCVKDAHIDMDVISSGKTGYLHVVWQPTGGEIVSETIEIESNDPKLPKQQIAVKAQIKASFSVSPAVVNFGLLERSDLPATRTLEVEKLGDVSADANLTFESKISSLETASTKTGKAKWDLQIALKPDAPLGPVDSRLAITPNWPGAKPYNVLILGKVIGDVEAEPDEIYVETSDLKPKFRRSFIIKSDGIQVKQIAVRPLDADLKNFVTVAVEGTTVNVDFTLRNPITPNTFRSRILCDVTLGDGKKETVLVPVALVR